MVARLRSAEEWVAGLGGIIEQYRDGAPRAQAIDRLVELSFSEGDAVRYLDGNRAKPAVSWK